MPLLTIKTEKPKDEVKLPMDFQLEAKKVLAYYYNELAELLPHEPKDEITVEEIYVVWFCKIIQNWKALVGTDRDDGMYYEITYNGNKKEFYVHSYHRNAIETVVNYEQGL